MDDLLLWKCNLHHMQKLLDDLLPRLAREGLHIQPPKCQLLTFGDVQGTHLMLQGFRLVPMRTDEPLIVMNAPMHPIIGDIDLLYFQINKARRKLFSIKHILQGPGRIVSKLKLLESVIFGSFRWMIGAVFPSPKAQQALNAFQMYAVAMALNIRRRPQELWVDYKQRFHRMARVCIFTNEVTRWGTLALRAFWQYTGHRVRAADGPCPTVATMLTNFRSLPWWTVEQSRAGGLRHRRHFPFLMGVERDIASIATEAWREKARSRAEWRELENRWVVKFEVPWSSNRQATLEDL